MCAASKTTPFSRLAPNWLVGLSAKNAVLIVEFARKLHSEGRSRREAAIEASRLRLRPIMMTSLAFTLGIVPLVIAKRPSSETQNALGTGLFGGMITATVLVVLFVQVCFASIMPFAERKTLNQAAEAVRQ